MSIHLLKEDELLGKGLITLRDRRGLRMGAVNTHAHKVTFLGQSLEGAGKEVDQFTQGIRSAAAQLPKLTEASEAQQKQLLKNAKTASEKVEAVAVKESQTSTNWKDAFERAYQRATTLKQADDQYGYKEELATCLRSHPLVNYDIFNKSKIIDTIAVELQGRDASEIQVQHALDYTMKAFPSDLTYGERNAARQLLQSATQECTVKTSGKSREGSYSFPSSEKVSICLVDQPNLVTKEAADLLAKRVGGQRMNAEQIEATAQVAHHQLKTPKERHQEKSMLYVNYENRASKIRQALFNCAETEK